MPWEGSDHEWGRRYTCGEVSVDALMEGGEVVLVHVAWRQPMGSVPLADGVRVSGEIADLMRWLARGAA